MRPVIKKVMLASDDQVAIDAVAASMMGFDPMSLEYISLAEYYMLSPYMAEFLAVSLLAGWLARKPEGPAWSWLLTGCALFLAGGWINNSLFDGNIEQGYYVFWRVLVFGTG